MTAEPLVVELQMALSGAEATCIQRQEEVEVFGELLLDALLEVAELEMLLDGSSNIVMELQAKVTDQQQSYAELHGELQSLRLTISPTESPTQVAGECVLADQAGVDVGKDALVTHLVARDDEALSKAVELEALANAMQAQHTQSLRVEQQRVAELEQQASNVRAIVTAQSGTQAQINVGNPKTGVHSVGV